MKCSKNSPVIILDRLHLLTSLIVVRVLFWVNNKLFPVLLSTTTAVLLARVTVIGDSRFGEV